MALARHAARRDLERSEEQLARAVRHPLLDLRPGEVLDPHCANGMGQLRSGARSAMCWSTSRIRWPSSATWFAPVRPGGRVVLQDDDHDVFRCWPEPAGFDRSGGAFQRSYDRLGCDPSSAGGWSRCCTKPAQRLYAHLDLLRRVRR